MKKLFTLILALPLYVNAAQLDEQELQPYLGKTTAWLEAFYANNGATLASLQTPSMNAMKSSIRKRSPMTNPKFEFNFDYKCQHYYITHTVKSNKFSGFGGTNITGVNVTPNAKNIVSVLSFSECGKDYVKHLSGFKVNFNQETMLVTSVKKELNLHQDEGFTQEEIDAYMNDYAVRVEKYTVEDIEDIDIESEKNALKERMGF